MTVKELYEKVASGKIISDIELQRAIVYDTAKQALVIDSIYHGIPLPAFYLWEREDGILEVLDGKQRIEAITKFKLSVKYLKDRAIWLQHKDAIWKEINDFMKTEGYSLSKTKEADIESMILGIVGNCRVDPKRLFTQDDKARLLSEKTPDENGLYECEDCHQHFRADELTVDHKRPWSLGGRTELSNAQLLCRACNSRKNNKN